MPSSLLRLLRFAAGLCLIVPPLLAQGASSLAVGDPSYADIDRLLALGLADSLIVGQRPYSRRQVVRIIESARARLAVTGESDFNVDGGVRREVETIVARLDRRFDVDDTAAQGSVRARLDELELSARTNEFVARRFTGVFAAPLAASVRPLGSWRLGRPDPPGVGAGVEAAERVDLAPWLAIAARARVEMAETEERVVRPRAELLLASVRARAGNAVLTVGREQLAWSTAPAAGLFIAARAPALDQVSLTSDFPFVLPGPLRLIGPMRATLVLADLGPSVVRSHSTLLGYKVSVRPAKDIELGATFLDHFGGTGGRASTLGDRLIDFLPFIDLFRTHNYTDSARALDIDSDKLLGVDGRLVLRHLGGIVVAGELLIDDFDVHRLPTLLTWDGAQSLDILVPRIASGPVALRLAVRHTGVRTYTHGPLAGGVTTRGRLIGDELGPDAKSFSLGADWTREPGLRVTLDASSALRSSANYVTETNGARFVIRRTERALNEQTDALVGGAVAQRADGTAVSLRAGLARVRNADFSARRRFAHAVELSFHLLR